MSQTLAKGLGGLTPCSYILSQGWDFPESGKVPYYVHDRQPGIGTVRQSVEAIEKRSECVYDFESSGYMYCAQSTCLCHRLIMG